MDQALLLQRWPGVDKGDDRLVTNQQQNGPARGERRRVAREPARAATIRRRGGREE